MWPAARNTAIAELSKPPGAGSAPVTTMRPSSAGTSVPPGRKEARASRNATARAPSRLARTRGIQRVCSSSSSGIGRVNQTARKVIASTTRSTRGSERTSAGRTLRHSKNGDSAASATAGASHQARNATSAPGRRRRGDHREQHVRDRRPPSHHLAVLRGERSRDLRRGDAPVGADAAGWRPGAARRPLVDQQYVHRNTRAGRVAGRRPPCARPSRAGPRSPSSAGRGGRTGAARSPRTPAPGSCAGPRAPRARCRAHPGCAPCSPRTGQARPPGCRPRPRCVRSARPETRAPRSQPRSARARPRSAASAGRCRAPARGGRSTPRGIP